MQSAPPDLHIWTSQSCTDPLFVALRLYMLTRLAAAYATNLSYCVISQQNLPIIRDIESQGETSYQNVRHQMLDY